MCVNGLIISCYLEIIYVLKFLVVIEYLVEMNLYMVRENNVIEL